MIAEKRAVIKRTSVNEQILDYMQDAIRSGKWGIGEKIPSEADLSDFFGVSKLTVRVALQQLIGMGVLEKRVGDGTYVKAFDFGSYVQKGFDFYMHPELLDQVCDFRLGIELKCCDLAVDACTQEELEELERLSDAFSQLVHSYADLSGAEPAENYFDKLAAADMAFHRQICVMSHNELLLNAFDMAAEPIRQYVYTVLRRRVGTREKNRQNVAELRDIHREIYEAIKAKDKKLCTECYKEMIDRDIEL